MNIKLEDLHNTVLNRLSRGSDVVCNRLPGVCAVVQQTKTAQRLEVSDPNLVGCCLLYTERRWLHARLQSGNVTEVRTSFT